MDPKTQIQPQKNTENTQNLTIKNQKNTAKKAWKFYLFPAIVLGICVWYGGYFRLYATPTPIAPNTVLDPSCAPGTDNCFVQYVPQPSTGTAGQILGNDGTNTLWVDQNGGVFPYAGQPVSRAFGDLSTTTAVGTATTTLSEFIKDVFFPAPTITWSVDHYYNVSDNFINDTTTPTSPSITFALNTTTGLSHPTCVSDGNSGLVCQKVDSSHINLSSAWTTTSGSVSTTHNYMYHRLAIWQEYSNGVAQGVYSTSTDAVAYNHVSCDQYADTPCTNSVINLAHTTSGAPTSANNVGSVLVGVSNSSGSICGITTVGPSNITTTSPCNGTFSSISNSGQSATFALTFGSTSGGQATDYTVQLKDTSGATISTITHHLTFVSVAPSYWFAACFNYTNNTDCSNSGGPGFDTTDGASVSKSSTTIASDFATLSTTCESPSTGCGTTTQTSHNRTINVNGLSHQHIYYAYPVTGAGGAISGTISDAVNGGSLSPDTSWSGIAPSPVTISLTNATGWTESYYLYSYLYDGSMLEKTNGNWQVVFPN